MFVCFAFSLESNNVSVFGAEVLLKALQACPALQLIRQDDYQNEILLSGEGNPVNLKCNLFIL